MTVLQGFYNPSTSFYFLSVKTVHLLLKPRGISIGIITTPTAQKMKFSITDFFSKWDKIRRNLRIWSHLLKKSVVENFIFCAVTDGSLHQTKQKLTLKNCNNCAKVVSKHTILEIFENVRCLMSFRLDEKQPPSLPFNSENPQFREGINPLFYFTTPFLTKPPTLGVISNPLLSQTYGRKKNKQRL